MTTKLPFETSSNNMNRLNMNINTSYLSLKLFLGTFVGSQENVIQDHQHVRNIIHIHNNVLWDWQCSIEYSPHLLWIWKTFREILSVPHNTIMDLNYVIED